MPTGVYPRTEVHRQGLRGARPSMRGKNHWRWKGEKKNKNGTHENTPQRKAYMKLYLKSYWQEYRKRKPEIIIHNRFLHKQRIKNAVGSFTIEEWLFLCEIHKNKCARCKEQKPLTKDHIIPLVRGGTNFIQNIQPLCSSCNASKGARIEGVV